MRKLARIECIRQVWGTLIARTTRPKTLDESAPLPTSLVTPPDPKTISAVLRQQGIYVRLQLSNVVMAELVDFAHQPPLPPIGIPIFAAYSRIEPPLKLPWDIRFNSAV